MTEINGVVVKGETWMEEVSDEQMVENPWIATNGFRDYFRTFSGNSQMRGEIQVSVEKLQRNIDALHVDLTKARKHKNGEAVAIMQDIRMMQAVMKRNETQISFYDKLIDDLNARLKLFVKRLEKIGFSKQRISEIEQAGISGTAYQVPRNCI